MSMAPPSTVLQMLRSLGATRVHTLIRYKCAFGGILPSRPAKFISPLIPPPPPVSLTRSYSSTASKPEEAPAGEAAPKEAASAAAAAAAAAPAAEAAYGLTGTNAKSPLLSKLFPQTSPEVYSSTEQDRRNDEEEEERENERAWQRMKLGFTVFSCCGVAIGVLAFYVLGRPHVDADGEIIVDEFTEKPLALQYLQRMWKSLLFYHQMILEPSRAKLLPDPFKHPFVQHRYTLVLEMNDVLVHPDWTYQTGWRFKKRPGLDLFLAECAKEFEIVIYTAEQGLTVYPLLDALDPNGYIMYRLVRDATHFVDGHHVKNLDNLNRDLSKVIVIDWDTNATKMHPDNTFSISRWLGNDDDFQLLDVLSFLMLVAQSDVEDVREVLHYYRQFPDPISQFRENQRQVAEQMEAAQRLEQAKAKPMLRRWTRNLLGR